MKPTVLAEQPAPVQTDGDIWRDILDDARLDRTVSPELYGLMAARRAQGIEQYGTPLQVGNRRDARADAIQEALDAIAYAELRRQELARVGEIAGALAWSYVREDAQRLAQRMLELP